VSRESRFVFRITLVQGLNRQIRRMCEYFGYEVTKLERIRIMNVSLKGLAVGQWRDLNEKELDGLFDAIRDSSSEAPANSGKAAKKKPAAKARPKTNRKPGSPPAPGKPGGAGRPGPKGKPAPGKKPASGKRPKGGKPRQKSVKR